MSGLFRYERDEYFSPCMCRADFFREFLFQLDIINDDIVVTDFPYKFHTNYVLRNFMKVLATNGINGFYRPNVYLGEKYVAKYSDNHGSDYIIFRISVSS